MLRNFENLRKVFLATKSLSHEGKKGYIAPKFPTVLNLNLKTNNLFRASNTWLIPFIFFIRKIDKKDLLRGCETGLVFFNRVMGLCYSANFQIPLKHEGYLPVYFQFTSVPCASTKAQLRAPGRGSSCRYPFPPANLIL